jgi:hypothetical protein
MSDSQTALEELILRMLEEAPEEDRLRALRMRGYAAARVGADWHLTSGTRLDLVVEDRRLVELLDSLSGDVPAWQPPAFVDTWEGPETDFSVRVKETVRGTGAETPAA